MNIEGAIRGMRNPLESWDNSDSGYVTGDNEFTTYFAIGPNDWKLALKLVKAGSDHRKFMRQIFVSMDITAPTYWWTHYATYKISTVENSTSKMHKAGTRYFKMSDFGWDYITSFREACLKHYNWLIDKRNSALKHDLHTEADKWWRELIQDLPDSYLYLRTVSLNYENLRNMYHARNKHKLPEWHEFCQMIKTLPYSELITIKK